MLAAPDLGGIHVNTPNTRRLAAPALAGGVLAALGVGATPALGAEYTLNLSAPSSTAVVGQPMIIQVSGSNPPDDFFSSWFSLDAIPTSVLPSCPSDYASGRQVAMSSSAQGGEVVVYAQREDVDSAGNFSMPVAYTPSMPGPFLLCGYTDDAATTTLAAASLALNVEDASGPGPNPSPNPSPSPTAKPASLERPRVRRSGKKLVCQRGSWSNSPSRYSYGWLVNGRAKRGASGQTLRITRKLRGRRVQCTVRASNAAGATIARSRPYRA
jgi:hypothetical protein